MDGCAEYILLMIPNIAKWQVKQQLLYMSDSHVALSWELLLQCHATSAAELPVNFSALLCCK